MIRRKLLVLSLVIIVANIAVDQVTKQIARDQLMGQGTISVVGEFFVLRYAENTGAFLGLGSDLAQPFRIILLILFPVIAIVAATFYLFRAKDLTTVDLVLLSSVIGGGVSNVVDRILFDGAVTDFLHFNFGFFRTGILNIADISIFFGGIIFAIVYARRDHMAQKALKADSAQDAKDQSPK